MNDTVTKLQLILPKLAGSLAGAIVALLATWALKKGYTLDSDTVSLIKDSLISLFTLLGYSLVGLFTTSKTNPANVASTDTAKITAVTSPQ